MKNILSTLVVIVLFGEIVNAQAPNWAWAKSAGGTHSDLGESIAVDANGNQYVTGIFQSDSIAFDATTLINNNSNIAYLDIFIAKYDVLGNLLWAKSAGGMHDDVSISIVVDSYQNVYITGYYTSQFITFDNIILTNSNNNNTYDIFIAKYDSLGNIIWAKNAGGTDVDISTSITADDSGNLYVTGEFRSYPINFGNHTLMNSPGFHSDVFVVKYDSMGTDIWAIRVGGNNFDGGKSICADVNNNLYLTGYFGSTTIIFGNDTLINSGYTDIFIAKYDSAGNVLWAKGAGGNYEDRANSIKTDLSGNSFITGYFRSTNIIFGSTNLLNTYPVANDFFIAKYDSTGNELWAKGSGGAYEDWGNSVAIDLFGNSYVTGVFSDSIIFGSYSFFFPFIGSYFFIVKYDILGNVLWAKCEGNSLYNESKEIAIDSNGYLYFTGAFSSSFLNLGSTTLVNVGSAFSDFFIAKLANITGTFLPFNTSNLVNIYPNPSQGNLTITSPSPITQLKITNTLGQLIYQVKPNDKRAVIKIYDKGIYFVSITTGSEVVTKKVVVEFN